MNLVIFGRGARLQATVLIALAVWLTVVPNASAKVTRVPQDYLEVGNAVYDAEDGDEIIVSPGLYSGPINCGNRKSLNIHSTDPTNWEIVNSTIIEGGGSTSHLPVVNLGSYSIRLAGFTIRNGGNGGVIGGGAGSIIEYCHILDNTGVQPRQTLALSGSPKIQSTPYVDDRLRGGGVYGCMGTIQNCMIERNGAELGGGIADCGGVIQNNFIVRNRIVDYGNRGAAGAAIWGCSSKIRGNTIVDNGILKPTADNTSVVWRGGGLSLCNGAITNNVIWVSRTDLFPEVDRCSKPTFSCIKGWTGGGQGNINSDPQLMNAKFDETRGDHAWPSQDWRLRPESPCIDTGTTAGLTTDFYGKARGKAWRSDKVRGDNTHTDMGAHEFIPDKLSLWVPKYYEPLISGGPLRVKYAIEPGAGTAFTLALYKGTDGKLAELGQFTTEAGHVDYDTAGGLWLKLPSNLITATDYTVGGQLTGSAAIFQSPPFWLMRTSAIEPGNWSVYK